MKQQDAGENEILKNFMMGNSVGKGSPGRPMRRWESNIKVDPEEVDWEGVDCSHRAHHWWTVVNTVMNLRVP
jgi:hypothetical protein